MLIRKAHSDEAAKACDVLRRSIVELCGADHLDDPAILQRWLANKTPTVVGSWIGHSDNFTFVAVEGEAVLALGIVRRDGEITCNYVSPDARFRGVSKAMLSQLEAVAREHGNDMCRLSSTETARRFYLACGYAECGAPEGRFGTAGSYPMQKKLASA